MVALDPYPRGFVIFRTDSAPALPEGWAQFDLPAIGWSFSHDLYYIPEIVRVPDDDKWVLVHGLCLHADPEHADQSPAAHLAGCLQRSSDQFLNALDYLGGRHLILRGSSKGFDIFQDAAGMRSVYYSPEARLVSSHLNLLNDIHEHPIRTEEEGGRALIHSWDSTRYIGAGPLLPNHYLDSETWVANRFFPRQANRYHAWSTTQKLDEFKRIWRNQMESLIARREQLVMSITGGSDSRTSLALSVDWVDDIEFFTYTADQDPAARDKRTLAMDVVIVEQIKNLIPLRHKYFKFEEQNKPLRDQLDPLLSKNTPQRHSRWLIPHYVEAFPEKRVIHIRGNGYEIGRAHWGARANNSTITSLKNLYLQLTKANIGYLSAEQRSLDFQRGITKWSYDHQLFDYHLRDIYYWEIRSGRWLAEILNETDIAFETHVPLNVRALLEIALSLPLDERLEGTFFSDLINASYPVLNFPGKNTEKNLYDQFRDLAQSNAVLRAIKSRDALKDDLTIVNNDGNSTSYLSTSNNIYIPKEHFQVGNVAFRLFRSANAKGSLSFTLLSDYENRNGEGAFEYRVVIDDHIKLRWDGALLGRPVHVTVDGVTPNTRVAIAVAAIKDQYNKQSWQEASEATIEDITFVENPRSSLSDCRVSADLPRDN